MLHQQYDNLSQQSGAESCYRAYATEASTTMAMRQYTDTACGEPHSRSSDHLLDATGRFAVRYMNATTGDT